MARRAQHNIYALPSRQWLRRALLLMLTVAALVLLSMSKNDHPAAVKLRTAVLDVVTPVIAFAASPFDAIAAAGEWVVSAVNTHAENVALKNQNLQLLQWQTTAQRLEAENASLRRLLNVVPSQTYSYITARMVADLSSPFAQSGLISSGTEQGVKVDQAVINEHGLVGRVMEVGDRVARVLLLNDINSRVPVIAERAREKSMLAGNNGPLPTLDYVPMNSQIKVGERLVTSGDGGIFPAGIPVGVVTSIEDDVVTVRPLADTARIEYVSIVNYTF